MITPILNISSDGNIALHHFTPKAKTTDPVVVMCHPTGFCAQCFSSVAAHLRGLNIFGIDMRSHGYSDRQDVTKWEGFSRDVAATFEFLITFTGHIHFIGVGISSGASAHILNAAENPQLYSGLFLCEPILFEPGSKLESREKLAESARKRKDSFASKDVAYEKFLKSAFSVLNPSSLGSYCAHGLKDEQDHVSLRCNKRDEEMIYLSGGGNGVYEALSHIDCPTMIVYGENSTTIDSNKANMISDQISTSNVIGMKGVGHFTLFENPYIGALMISSFISRTIVNQGNTL